jgi:uncharacterized repeat protein (TIGR04138 family)
VNEPETDLEDLLDRILASDPRYRREAYLFTQRALQYYRDQHGDEDRESPHISGGELLVGVRQLAILEFGPMARLVLASWGVRRGEDVGEIVYNLIGTGLMSKTAEDSKEDFAGIMNFDESMDRDSSW